MCGAPAKRLLRGAQNQKYRLQQAPGSSGGVDQPLTHLQFLEAGRHLSLGFCFVGSGSSWGCCAAGMER